MKSKLPLISIVAALGTMLIGIVVLFGWVVQNDLMRIFMPGQITMKFNVAISFILLPLSLLMHYNSQPRSIGYYLSILFSVVVMSIGLLTLTEYILSINIGIDELLIHDRIRTTSTYFAGRMSPLTAINLILLGSGMLLLDRPRTAFYQLIYLTYIVFFSILMLIGFNLILDIPTYVYIAVPTTIGFGLFAGAVYFAQPMVSQGISFERRLLVRFSSIIILVVIISALSFYFNDKREQTTAWVQHTGEVLQRTDQTLSLVRDIESSNRAYITTGDSVYLRYYAEAVGGVDSQTLQLRALTMDNPAQMQRVDSLRALIHNKILFAQRCIQARDQSGFDAAQKLFLSGSTTNDAIRKVVLNIEDEERRLLVIRRAASDRSISASGRAFYIFLASIFILLMIVIYTVYVNNYRRRQIEAQLRQASEEVQGLYDKAPCGYFSVDAKIYICNINQTLLRWLGYTADEVVDKMKYEDLLSPASREKHLNTFDEVFAAYIRDGYINDVEFEFQRKDGTIFPAIVNSFAVLDDKGNFVKSRSTVFDNTERKKNQEKLIAANKELESFSYSVSHDLRAPLRGIHGFTKILSEDYGPHMDSEANRLMTVILGNAKKMGQLIDDLLDFSRLGRKELNIMTVRMDQMVSNICKEMRAEIPDRDIEFHIKELGTVEADAIVMKQVWVNLISNAIKYTKGKSKAVIEIGSERNGDEVIYYIHDNGAGFDMQYVDKLFGVFQRLHAAKDFDGTGVGLAIVHRIITRHKGRVWADAKMNEGATFYFSLPIN